MTADELLRHITNALFVLVALRAIATAAQERTRPAVDAAVFFGILAFVVVQGEAARILGVRLPPAVATLSVVLIVSLPYLFVRLVDDLSGVRPGVLRGSLLVLLVLSVALAVAPTPLPVPITVFAVVYFAGLLIYGSVLLVREARRGARATRPRTQAAALGSLLLGAVVVVAGIRLVAPVPDALTRLMTLGAALAYAAAFAPPLLLRRSWREPTLRAFLSHAAAMPPTAPLASVTAELESAVAEVAGAAAVDIATRERGQAGAARLLTGETVSPESLLHRAMSERRSLLSTDLERDDPAGALRHRAAGVRSLVAAPVVARGEVIGVLGAYLRRIPLFVDEEKAVADTLGMQSGAVLDGAYVYTELLQTNDRLERATRAKTEFLANMSHELRTPMNAILGFSDLLMEQLGQSITSEQQRYFNNIKDAGGHLLQLINEVLDMSRVEAGRLDLRPEVSTLDAALDPVLASARDAAAEAGVTFEARIAPDRQIRADAGRLRQILYNLLSNATKFTEAGGRVVLTADVRGQDLHIEVSDTGVGIPAELHGKVFGTFERLHEGRAGASGTGLGLALTKRLVELHGGSIAFESAPGRGTTFRVRLPNLAADPMTGRRLLIVEDEQRDAELIAALATAAGLRSEIVRSAAGARAALRRDPPTGVVLDLRLPDERGERVLEELKSQPSTRSIPVIVVTVEDDEGRSRPLGADDHLTKPIDADRLSLWLRRTSARAEAGGGRSAAAPE